MCALIYLMMIWTCWLSVWIRLLGCILCSFYCVAKM
nr:MAG TPA: hypothetical protein [Caudoviricetes sp.]